ncbi:hypothetical protein P167DRAFT_574488 [Morchella conica CCBAS932]|uniref:Uncharacterized protein n=1 Tax=Morchella conica CCBAS932 TaxID=1392247 RepID=A0A3N4KPK8_9PEZI|nr:hypothetical protein P167DRAFT_574488 [Morchella conica CCBAS932]
MILQAQSKAACCYFTPQFSSSAAAVEATTAAAEGVEASVVDLGQAVPVQDWALATLALTAIIEIGLLIYEGVIT